MTLHCWNSTHSGSLGAGACLLPHCRGERVVFYGAPGIALLRKPPLRPKHEVAPLCAFQLISDIQSFMPPSTNALKCRIQALWLHEILTCLSASPPQALAVP